MVLVDCVDVDGVDDDGVYVALLMWIVLKTCGVERCGWCQCE